MNDTIYRQETIKFLRDKVSLSTFMKRTVSNADKACIELCERIKNEVPSAEPGRLTDEDFETIRIHLNAYKEQLCNQHRWEEAEEYQRIIDRFISFASAQPERKKGKWIPMYEGRFTGGAYWFMCSNCGRIVPDVMNGGWDFCPKCGEEKENGDDT